MFSKGLFLVGLSSEGLIIGGNFAFQNGLGLTIKTALNTTKPTYKTASTKSIGLYSGGRISGRIFASEIWGAYFREGL